MEEMNDTENRVTVSKLTDVMVIHFMENKEMKVELERTGIRQRAIVFFVIVVSVVLILVAVVVAAMSRLRLANVRKHLAEETLESYIKSLVRRREESV